MATMLVDPPERLKATVVRQTPARPASLGDLDRAVVRLGISDRRGRLGVSRFLAVLAKLGGERPPNGLADPKLEALRRYVMIYPPRRPATAEIESDRMQDAGYSRDQIAHIDGLLDRSRASGQEPGRIGWFLPAIAMLPFTWLLYVVNIQIENWPISAVITASIALPIAPLFARSARRPG